MFFWSAVSLTFDVCIRSYAVAQEVHFFFRHIHVDLDFAFFTTEKQQTCDTVFVFGV